MIDPLDIEGRWPDMTVEELAAEFELERMNFRGWVEQILRNRKRTPEAIDMARRRAFRMSQALKKFAAAAQLKKDREEAAKKAASEERNVA